MMFKSIRPIQYLWKAISAENRTGQIAWGIALGVLVGLIPKGNLTAWAFGIVLFATRVNLGAGLLTALVVSSVGFLTDPLTHGIGLKLLSQEFIQQRLLDWHNAPLVPWLALNNTVVLGSTILGLALLYPVQHVARTIIDGIRPHVDRFRNTDASAADTLATQSPKRKPALASQIIQPQRWDF